MLSDDVKVVTVNGRPQSLHSSLDMLNHQRAVTLAGLKGKRKNYSVYVRYQGESGAWFHLEPGNMVSVEDGMMVHVAWRMRPKRWWQFWR